MILFKYQLENILYLNILIKIFNGIDMFLNPKEHELHKGYYYIPDANETIVNKNGDCIHILTNKKLPKWLDKKTNKNRCIIKHNGKNIYISISLLIGKMFLDIPVELNDKPIIIEFKDGNSQNDSLCNLKWISYREKQIESFLNKRKELKYKYTLPDYIDNIDFYNQEAIECPFKPGYYYIPFTKAPIVINKNGDLFNLETNSEHPFTINKKGYKITQLGSDNFKSIWQVHRIVGLIFIKKPIQFKDISFQQLEINHKNCNKTDNLVDNLEWTTKYINMKHAWENNLVNTNKIVLVRNILTNEVREIFSISECAKEFKIDHSVFNQHINSISAGRVIKFNHVFLLKEKFKKWPDKLMIEVNNKFRPFCRFVFFNIITREEFIFFSLPDACHYLNININILKNNRSIHNGKKPVNNWLCITFNQFLIQGERFDII